MGRAIVNLTDNQNKNTMARISYLGPYRSGYRMRPWARPIIVTPPVVVAREIGQKCKEYVTDSRGNTWVYTGRVESDGRCHWYSRKPAPMAFDGERAIWSDLQGDRYSEVIGPDGKEYPAGTTIQDINSGKATPVSERTGKGWDVASQLLTLANQFIGTRQDTAQANVTVPVPEPQPTGMSTGAVIGLVAGVAVIGGIIYFIAKK